MGSSCAAHSWPDARALAMRQLSRMRLAHISQAQRLRARARATVGSHMLELNPGFRQLDRKGGYPRLEDMGLIGDGTTAALVGLDGSIPWLCLPRFDSEPLLCGLLDAGSGGAFTVAPEEVLEARQRYEPDTAVLVTELRSPTGVLAVTDALALRPSA